jgi:hypothetical protein
MFVWRRWCSCGFYDWEYVDKLTTVNWSKETLYHGVHCSWVDLNVSKWQLFVMSTALCVCVCVAFACSWINLFRILVGKTSGNAGLWTPKWRWEDIIKRYIKEVSCSRPCLVQFLKCQDKYELLREANKLPVNVTVVRVHRRPPLDTTPSHFY